MLHNELICNRHVSMNSMKLYKQTVLHIVDRDTKFSAAAFISTENKAAVWQTFMESWAIICIGFPDIITVAQGPKFQSAEFTSFLATAGIEEHDADVKIYNVSGECERYNAYLHNVYSKVKTDSPTLGEDLSMVLAVKGVNDAAGPSRLTPTRLVSGVHLRMLVHPIDLPNQREQM